MLHYSDLLKLRVRARLPQGAYMEHDDGDPDDDEPVLVSESATSEAHDNQTSPPVASCSSFHLPGQPDPNHLY